ncbi:acyl-CoA dehydrogenase family protein [Methylobacterium sp. NEAU 140]|uniref:acyl-CoA dehydrogenase family protein n=1 Tax=Methylobacterium sp. NEAU 140 TaxID=3064945 RepID=UPI002733B171|nr:acyl-CoA dehydrogenase family protein [Methylobacterium sp. NEAU 140]MDP4021480.1 acyl-CoA dehydrogenase family protein [Methylobacterium sp. NEAU 140]
MHSFRFTAEPLPAEAEAAREAVRAFLAAELAAGGFVPHRTTWTTFDPDFSRRAGAAGFVGLTVPTEYGGHGRSGLVRYVVTEEMLAAGAPCGAHWIADRQSGPQILRHGTEAAKRAILPRICAGDCSFGIGMSEPGSGSDLAAVRTRAVRDGDGWVINGSKIWTTNAHRVDYLLALVRTGDPGPDRHGGLTQFIVDLAAPGVTVRPILDLSGHHEFNEVFFSDYRVSDAMMVGAEGAGWGLVTEELAFERSGPDRFLSDYRLLVETIDRIGPEPDRFQAAETGRLVAQLAALMGMSGSVARLLDRGIVPGVEAALVKDVGTGFEREVPEVARRLVPVEPSLNAQGEPYREALAHTTLRAPSFTLRGGTREVLRGVIARGLGLR